MRDSLLMPFARFFPALLLLTSLLLASPVLVSADTGARQAYVIELHNQLPDNLITAIKPLLADGDGISSYNNSLLVTTDAAHIATVRQLIAQLDKPLHNLLISVRNNQETSSTNSSSGLSGGISHENIILETGEPVAKQGQGITVEHDGLAYSTQKTERRISTRAAQQIRALEGSPAFIYTGQSRQVPTRDAYGNVYSSQVDANQGFYVTARIQGELVQLTIATSNDAFQAAPGRSHNDDTVNTQHLSTTINGRVGEWIALGGVTLGDTDASNSQVKKITTRSGNLGDIAIKIDPAD